MIGQNGKIIRKRRVFVMKKVFRIIALLCLLVALVGVVLALATTEYFNVGIQMAQWGFIAAVGFFTVPIYTLCIAAVFIFLVIIFYLPIGISTVILNTMLSLFHNPVFWVIFAIVGLIVSLISFSRNINNL